MCCRPPAEVEDSYTLDWPRGMVRTCIPDTSGNIHRLRMLPVDHNGWPKSDKPASIPRDEHHQRPQLSYLSTLVVRPRPTSVPR